jgi:hypothetical protein
MNGAPSNAAGPGPVASAELELKAQTREPALGPSEVGRRAPESILPTSVPGFLCAVGWRRPANGQSGDGS